MEPIELDAKLHNNYDWMYDAYVVKGLNVSEIANTLNISVKLVHLKLKEHKLVQY